MPVDIKRIGTLLGYNRGYIAETDRDIGRLEAGIRAKFAAFWGLLYENLRRGPRWERDLEAGLRDLPMEERIRILRGVAPRLSEVVRYGRRSARGYAELIILEYDLRARVWFLREAVGRLEVRAARTREMEVAAREHFIDRYGREPTPEELHKAVDYEYLDRAIELKEGELDFLESASGFLDDLAASFDEVGLYGWGARARGIFARVTDFIERVLRWLEELRKMRVLWRVHKSRMYYVAYPASPRGTPSPFSMISVFVYTTKPEEFPEELFDSALDELEASGMGSLSFARVSASKAAVRMGYGPPGAEIKVEGWEKEEVERGEMEEGYEEDQWRWYMIFYHEMYRRSTLLGEYWGWLEPVEVAREIVGWRVFMDGTKPKWWKPGEAAESYESFAALGERFVEEETETNGGQRITLDIDHSSEWRRLAQYFNMKHLCGVDEVRVSPSGRGLHLIKRGLGINYEQSLGVRAVLGECGRRLEFDDPETTLMKPRQILWRAKIIDGKRYDAEQIDERSLLALPWVSRLPRGFYVEAKR